MTSHPAPTQGMACILQHITAQSVCGALLTLSCLMPAGGHPTSSSAPQPGGSGALPAAHGHLPPPSPPTCSSAPGGGGSSPWVGGAPVSSHGGAHEQPGGPRSSSSSGSQHNKQYNWYQSTMAGGLSCMLCNPVALHQCIPAYDELYMH